MGAAVFLQIYLETKGLLTYVFLNIVEYQERFQMKLISFKKCLHCKQKLLMHIYILSEILINICGMFF